MSIANLEDLFLHELKDILNAERQLVDALPKLANKATNEKLQAAFEEHLSVTEKHVDRLERIFGILGQTARGKKCKGMEGLIKEGSELIKEEDAGPAVDAALIAAAQKVEHYEIAAYGTLATYAKMLGMDDAVELLAATLAEEKQTDEALTELAESINFEAQVEEESAAE